MIKNKIEINHSGLKKFPEKERMGPHVASFRVQNKRLVAMKASKCQRSSTLLTMNGPDW